MQDRVENGMFEVKESYSLTKKMSLLIGCATLKGKGREYKALICFLVSESRPKHIA